MAAENPMKKSSQITFVVLFLAMIFSVPTVQTVYEYRTNPGHRIQMLDLAVDLFLTPLKKANKAKAGTDSLVYSIGLLDSELVAARAVARYMARPQDAPWDKSPDMEKAKERCDEAVFRVSMLKRSLIDFNRHVTGAANFFAGQDTLRPLYVSLVKIDRGLATVAAMLQFAPPDLDALEKALDFVKDETGELKKRSARDNYFTLTLTAFRRIMVGSNYLRPYETEMEKSSLFAGAVRPWMLLGNFRIFGDLGSKGVKGTHEWFFYRSDVDYLVKPDVFDPRSRSVDANDAPVTGDIVGAIVDFKEQLRARGIDLLFVIMPAKPSVYPDLLNPSASPVLSGCEGNSQKVMLRLHEAGIETIDLFTPLSRERALDASSGDAIYLRTDTHFKGRGVLTTARAVAERVKQYPWYNAGTAEFAVDTVMVLRYGDIGEMIGLPVPFMGRHPYPFSAESTVCSQVYSVKRNETGAVTARTLYKDDYRSSKILVLGDSFSRIFQTDQPRSAGWISHLAAELSQPVASLVNDGGASTLVRQALARKPNLLKNKKLVIWEVVERDFRYGAEGWKRVCIDKRQ